jgi:hypothetical protein
LSAGESLRSFCSRGFARPNSANRAHSAYAVNALSFFVLVTASKTTLFSPRRFPFVDKRRVTSAQEPVAFPHRNLSHLHLRF